MPGEENILSLIRGQIKLLEEADAVLTEISNQYGGLSAASVESPEDLQRAMEAQAVLLSSVSTSSYILNWIFDRLEEISEKVVKELQEYLDKLWSTIIKHMLAMEINKITVNLSTPPSVTIELLKKE